MQSRLISSRISAPIRTPPMDSNFMPFSQQSTGLIYGLAAYLMWGTFPLFFHYIGYIPSLEILSHRIVWSCVFVGLLLLLMPGSLAKLKKALAEPGLWKSLLASALLISTNWLAFIWTVSQGDVLASSLGYFITPLVSVMLAWVFIKERLDSYRLLACILAASGVLWQVISIGQLPWLSLILACSFGLYGLVRKQQPTDTLTGLMLETLILMPVAAIFLGYLHYQQQGFFARESLEISLLLMFSGVVTALPLLAFAAAAKRLQLTTVGFLMYINPCMQFITAVFILDEPFNSHMLITFGLIWAALTVFSLGSWRQHRRNNLPCS